MHFLVVLDLFEFIFRYQDDFQEMCSFSIILLLFKILHKYKLLRFKDLVHMRPLSWGGDTPRDWSTIFKNSMLISDFPQQVFYDFGSICDERFLLRARVRDVFFTFWRELFCMSDISIKSEISRCNLVRFTQKLVEIPST